MAKLLIALIVCNLLALSRALPTANTNNIYQDNNLPQNWDFPYSVFVEYSGRFNCGGALIEVNGTQVILTSPWCVNYGTPSNYRVVGRDESRLVKRIAAQEDLALAILWLDSPFNYSENTSSIALPTQGQETSGDVIVTAYPSSLPVPSTFEAVQVPIVSQEVCQEAWSGTEIAPSMFCFGPMSESLCEVEFGAPVRSVDGDYLAGILISRKAGNCDRPQNRIPIVATKISQFIDWIHIMV